MKYFTVEIAAGLYWFMPMYDATSKDMLVFLLQTQSLHKQLEEMGNIASVESRKRQEIEGQNLFDVCQSDETIVVIALHNLGFFNAFFAIALSIVLHLFDANCAINYWIKTLDYNGVTYGSC